MSFEGRGYERLGVVLDEETLVKLRARAEEIMLGERKYPGFFYQLRDREYGKGFQGPSLEYRKLEKLELDPEFRRVIEHPRFGEVMRDLSKGSGISLYRAVLFNKPASGGVRVSWHQDGGKMWGIDRDPLGQIWVALDDAPEDGGCLEIIPGSHKNGLASELGGEIQEPLLSATLTKNPIEFLPAKAGEAILLHNYLWHASGPTKTGAPRRALSICYLEASTKCTRTRHAPREFLPLFSGQLPQSRAGR